MKVEIKKQPKATLELKITVPNSDVKKVYEQLFDEIVKLTEIKGFRKGQAPKDLVKEKTDMSKFYGDVINELLQKYYPQALKEHHISPVSNPHVTIQKFDIEQDFEFTAVVATKPEIKLGDYKKEIKKIFEKKSKEIKKANQERLKKGEKLEHDHHHLTTNDIIEGLLNTSTLDVADILIDEETDRMLTRLANQAQAVGLSMDQYLKAQDKSSDELREEFRVVAERTVKTEFVLAKLVEENEIKVTGEEVEQMAVASGDPEAQSMLEDPVQVMYIKSVLAKNKAISQVAIEIEKELGIYHGDNDKNTHNKDTHNKDKETNKTEKTSKNSKNKGDKK